MISAGFSRVDITPGLGVDIAGYYQIRKTNGVLDPLEVGALALALGETRVLLLSFDVCGIKQASGAVLREDICAATGLSPEAVIISATHTHTGPRAEHDHAEAPVRDYFAFLRKKAVEAAKAALTDLKPAKVGWGVTPAEGVSFCRRFRMKDGSVQTNPGIGNPHILEEAAEMDRRLTLLRFDQEGGNTILLTHFANHPDSVGGDLVSADWPGFLRRTVERAIPDTKCLFFNGTEGDVGHINPWGKGGYFNDTFRDFDDVIRGYGHTRHMGNLMAGAVLQIYDKVNYFEPSRLQAAARKIRVPSHMPKAEELPEARRIDALHAAGKDEELPYTGMMLTTVVAEARRMLRLEHGPRYFEMTLSALALGDVVLLGIPGEAFTGVGIALKETEDWALVVPLGLTNGHEGYFPMQECYDEGGYETRCSPFAPGVAEYIIQEGKALLKELKRSMK